MSTSLKDDILKAVAESKCNTCALSHACNNYDKHHCKENDYRRYEPREERRIKGTSWNGQINTKEKDFRIQFQTDDYEKYKQVEKLCQELIDKRP